MPQNPPEGYHTITPQIIAEDARETFDFLVAVFGATPLDVYENNGRIMHSELRIGDSRLMLASSSEEFGTFPLMTNPTWTMSTLGTPRPCSTVRPACVSRLTSSMEIAQGAYSTARATSGGWRPTSRT